ncbi:carbohydrate esterase family 16 protein [Mucor lusitanicus]
MDSLTYACRNCTSAGGPNWVIYLTDSTQWISWDFAYNSAPVNNSIVNQVVIDVSTQVRNLYQQIFIAGIVDSVYNKRGIQHTHESTLVTIWVGINDIDLTYNWNSTDQLDLLIMHRYQILINFMLINVPPIHRAPMWHNTENEKLIETRVIEYNKKLEAMVKHLKSAHASAITFIEYDAWQYFDKLLDDPKEHGITDVLTFCPDW